MAQQPAYLLLPGFQNSDHEHWQSIWERTDPAFRRLEQKDWDHPDPEDWTETLDRAVQAHDGPLVLVAHSLGCVTVARWAARTPAPRTTPVVGALLVAPPDIDHADVPELAGFRPVPLRPLPFPSIVVVGSDDPWAAPSAPGCSPRAGAHGTSSSAPTGTSTRPPGWARGPEAENCSPS